MTGSSCAEGKDPLRAPRTPAPRHARRGSSPTARARRRARSPSRIVVVGDLNGADDALQAILRGTRLCDADGRWIGGRAHLVQVGDVFNRGSTGRAAFERLMRLQREAPRAGGAVTVLLGNHEAMTALRHEGYCSEGEYLSFATARQRAAWPGRVLRTLPRLAREPAEDGVIAPIGPRMAQWRVENVPGRAALRRAFSPTGRIGRTIRRLPVAARVSDHVFVHAGLTRDWAQHGLDGLNDLAARTWNEAPEFIGEVPARSVLRAPDGPLWLRALAKAPSAAVRAEVDACLAALGARRLVVGHTPTAHVRGGRAGHVALRAGTRLACVDVGLTEGQPQTWAALVIRGRVGREWRPDGSRELWRD